MFFFAMAPMEDKLLTSALPSVNKENLLKRKVQNHIKMA